MKKGLYQLRIILFIVQFYLIFGILENILQMELIGYAFLFLYTFYIVKIILELLSKKKRYQTDIVYNFLQIGLSIYISIIAFKIYYEKILVTVNTRNYLFTNYVILSLLITFILLYTFITFNSNFKSIKYK